MASERDSYYHHDGEQEEGEENGIRSDELVALEENETCARHGSVEAVVFEDCDFDLDRFLGKRRECLAHDFLRDQEVGEEAYAPLACRAPLHEAFVAGPPRAASASLSLFSLLPIAFSAPRIELVLRPSSALDPRVQERASVSALLASPCRMRRPQNSLLLSQKRVPFYRARLFSLLR